MSEDDDRNELTRGQLNTKRRADEARLAELAKALTALSSKQLAKLNLSEEIVEVVDEARRMRSHAALARQLRIVRRELRKSESEAIGVALDALVNPRGPTIVSEAQGAAQAWAARLVDDGDPAVEAFLVEHPSADRQHLRGLARSARKADAKKLAKARKTLVSTLLALMQAGER